MWLAGRVRTFLSHFYRPDDPQALAEAAEADWVEVLKDYRTAEVQAAMLQYLRAPERSASCRAVRPGPWAIRDLILKARPKPKLVRTDDPWERRTEAERKERGIGLTPEELAARRESAARIMREVAAGRRIGE